MKLFSSLTILELLFATVLGTIVPEQYLKPGYDFSSIHFDEFCKGDDGGEGWEREGSLSVVLKQEVGDVDLERAGPCVCFGRGIYEYYGKSIHFCTNKKKFDFKLPTPILYQVLSDQVCIQVPNYSKAFKKVEDEVITERDEEILGVEAPLSITAHFLPCSKGNEKVLRRMKREDAAAAPAAAAAAPAGPAPVTTKLADEADEDFLNVGTEVGHELMRNQMNQYIESVIARLTGLQGEGVSDKGSGRKYPAIKLLDYTKQLMQKTCTAVNPDFFDLALNSFVNLQLETYHIKEPYIGYSAFRRIELAMRKCLTQVHPHVFVANVSGTVLKGGEMCENQLSTKTGGQTVLEAGTKNEQIINITIPTYGSSTLKENVIAEPLIETVWKMLVSAHSGCYMYFSEYFNDHHTYTVALLPLFTNAIQDIWLKGGEGYDLKEGNKLYGGLLGDVKKILTDVDRCVGASRAASPYPWFMNRPLKDKSNDWNRRKKRDIEEEKIETENGHVMLDNFRIAHKCKKAIEIDDVC